MELVPRTEDAINFLKKWRPAGPWVLTSIAATSGKISTKTFTGEQVPEMTAWLGALNGKTNLYFTINPTVGNFDNKPKRTDVTHISVLHVDIDPRAKEFKLEEKEAAAEYIQKEQGRILKRLREFHPAPSIIVSSGGGYQAYWVLEEPILLDCTEASAMEAEGYSVQLEILLEGDRTSNADRIMRIPGTVNFPNEVKLRKGRIPALSFVVDWNEVKYPLSEFTKAQTKVQQKEHGVGKLPGGGEKVKISGEVAPIYLEDLIEKNITISDHIKVLIVQGHNPDNPKQYPSRSESLWAVVCELVRAKADDETIAGIIMNRDNGISASVLDKPRPERYAAKQIQDAKEEVADPVLREMNSKHAVISDLGGKCRIITEVYDYTLKRSKISYQSFPDFGNRYCNKKVQIATDSDGKPVYKSAGKWWTEHPQRRQYETVVFSPGREVPDAYNLWQGFACEAIPGDVGLFLQHIKDNLCKGAEEYYTYIISWMARAVQQPDCQGEVAIVLRGEMGTGKSIFAKHFGSLFGRHFLQVSDPKHLIGSFNSHLRDAVILFGDEAFFAGDKKHESVLKALVTEATLTIEAKGVDVQAAPNYTHLILASNSNWVVPAGSNERRYFALDVGAEKMQNKKYFSAIGEQMEKGGREALLHFLLHYDISNFEVRDVPKTNALQDQKILSMSNEEAWWFEKLEEGRMLKEHDSWEREIQKTMMQDDYILFMQRIGIMRKNSPTVLGKFLARVCPGGMPKAYQRMAKIKIMNAYGEEALIARRVYFYELPELVRCREHWDKNHGGPFKWAQILEEEQEEFVQVSAENAFR